jgi:hypothetical protein
VIDIRNDGCGTMEVIVDGVSERRAIDYYSRNEGRWLPGMAVANPVLRGGEMVARTLSGEVLIVRTK